MSCHQSSTTGLALRAGLISGTHIPAVCTPTSHGVVQQARRAAASWPIALPRCDIRTLSNGSRHADRKTVGRAEGRITVNGFDKVPATFARVMGYCEQFDIHSPGLTVGESIRLSSDLRLSENITTEEVRPLPSVSRADTDIHGFVACVSRLTLLHMAVG